MVGSIRLLLAGAWLTVLLVAAGNLVDLRWHAQHRNAEGVAELVAAHWLIWVGLLLVIIVAAVGAGRMPSHWYAGWRLLLVAALAYAAFEMAHLVSHARAHDSMVIHVLLQVGKAGLLAGAVSASTVVRRRHRSSVRPSS
jgi:TRAP-type C4-dicarboxylate transport system permease large subunit